MHSHCPLHGWNIVQSVLWAVHLMVVLYIFVWIGATTSNICLCFPWTVCLLVALLAKPSFGPWPLTPFLVQRRHTQQYISAFCCCVYKFPLLWWQPRSVTRYDFPRLNKAPWNALFHTWSTFRLFIVHEFCGRIHTCVRLFPRPIASYMSSPAVLLSAGLKNR